jgi:hypothetical protein
MMATTEKQNLVTPVAGGDESIALATQKTLLHASYQITTEINDILNAVALRLALLQWQPNGTRSDGDIARLTRFIEQLANLVQWLQHITRDIEEDSSSTQTAKLGRSTDSFRSPYGTDFREIRNIRTRSGHLMLVSERPGYLDSLRNWLEHDGCHVTAVANGQDALARLAAGQLFDQIICDTSVFGGTDSDFTAEIARVAPFANIFLLTERCVETGKEKTK